MAVSRKRSSSKKAMKRSSSKKRKSSSVRRKGSRVKRKSSRKKRTKKRTTKGRVMKGGVGRNIKINFTLNYNNPTRITINDDEKFSDVINNEIKRRNNKTNKDNGKVTSVLVMQHSKDDRQYEVLGLYSDKKTTLEHIFNNYIADGQNPIDVPKYMVIAIVTENPK